jgi:hypothetical protein
VSFPENHPSKLLRDPDKDELFAYLYAMAVGAGSGSEYPQEKLDGASAEILFALESWTARVALESTRRVRNFQYQNLDAISMSDVSFYNRSETLCVLLKGHDVDIAAFVEIRRTENFLGEGRDEFLRPPRARLRICSVYMSSTDFAGRLEEFVNSAPNEMQPRFLRAERSGRCGLWFEDREQEPRVLPLVPLSLNPERTGGQLTERDISLIEFLTLGLGRSLD